MNSDVGSGGFPGLARLCPMELILVDDGSRDADLVPRLGKSLQRKGVPTRILRSPLRIGQAAARNRGARRATGKWVYFADCDDVIHPEVVHRMSRLDADVIWAGAVRIHEDTGERVGVITSGLWSLRDFRERCRAGPGTVMLRRQFLYTALAFQPERFQYMEDFAWYVRLRMTRARHAFVQEPSCTYYVRPGNNRKGPMWDLWRPEVWIHANRYGNGVNGFTDGFAVTEGIAHARCGARTEE